MRKAIPDLELSDTWTKVLALCKNPEPRTRGIKARKGQGIPTPVELNTLPLQSKEGNQCADRDGAGESRGGDAEGTAQSV